MPISSLSAQDADVALCRGEGGVELALQYAKLWCRYAKDLLTWMDKRISLGKSAIIFPLISLSSFFYSYEIFPCYSILMYVHHHVK